MKQCVAGQAARERTEATGQVETPANLGGLMPAVGLSHRVPVGHGGMLEQAAVPRQKDALLLQGNPNQFWIAGAVAVDGLTLPAAGWLFPLWGDAPDDGFTTGVWDGNVRTATTTHMLTGYLRRNGAMISDQ